jgi:hypothetical protein
MTTASATLPTEPLAIRVTLQGRAAAAYLKALDTYVAECRTLYDANFEPTSAYYDAAASIARVTALETAANAYRDLGGFICEDCNQLEGCLCPNV